MTDRLSIDKKLKDTVVANIEERKFLGLDNMSIPHSEMFMFAAAIGIHMGIRTPLNSKLGFIQATALRGDQMSAIYSIMVDEMVKANTEDLISDQDSAFNIVQEYANTGFIEIGRWIEETKDNDKIWDLINDMNDMFEEYFQYTNTSHLRNCVKSF